MSEKQIEEYSMHLNIAKERGDRSGEGRTYGNLGNVYRRLGDFRQAIEHHNQHLSIAKELGDRAEEGCVYGNLGIAYHCLGDVKKAIQYHNQHLSIAKELGDRAKEGRAYGNLGNAYRRLGDFKQAINYHSQCLTIAKEVGDRAGEGGAYGNLGNAYDNLGNFKQAIDYHNKHLNMAKELGDRSGEGRGYGNLGNAYQSLCDFKQAIECHNQHLSIAKELGDKAGEGTALGNLGNAHYSLGNAKEAIKYHNQHLSIAKELGDKAGEGMAYGNLGNAYRLLGAIRQAIEYHNKDLKIAKELGDKTGEGGAYGNLGNAYHSLGDFKQAIEYHNQRLSIAKEVGDRAGEGSAYGNLGNAYHHLGDYKKAIEYHSQCLAIAKEVGDLAGEGGAYGNLGNAHDSLGDFERAIDYHRQHRSIAKELGDRAGEGAANGNLGNAYESLGDFNQAKEYHNQRLCIAKELGDKAGEGRAYGNLGNAYRLLGDFKQAIEYYKQHLNTTKELEDKAGEGAAFYSLGSVFELSGSLHEALECYRSSVRLYNEVRALLQSEDEWKISFRDACKYAYTTFWRTLVRLEKTDQALCVAEQGRAQALNDLMKLQYDSELLTSGPFEPKLTTSGILSYTATQTVFIALERNTIYLWLLKDGDVHFKKNTIEDVTLLVKGAFQKIGVSVGVKCENRTLDEPESDVPVNNEDSCQGIENNALRRLFDSIISPITNKLEGDELVIVPDGPLCLAPYAACMDEASRYLCESTRIRILPSLTSLKLITDCPDDFHKKTGALLVGNPSVEEVKRIRGKRARLSCLPRAEEEVKIIGEILKAEPLTARDATKDEVLKRMGSVALVHIAAHGDMEAGEIALAPNPDRTSKIPKDKDFLLTMSDVHTVKLQAKLVVLSCCHSAQGKVTAEGVVGIGRAFLGAGARSVLVSLWAVDDEATMEFMKSFYTHLGGGCSASVALNRAMECLRESEKFGAVKHWAPFVLIGDDVSIEFEDKQG